MAKEESGCVVDHHTDSVHQAGYQGHFQDYHGSTRKGWLAWSAWTLCLSPVVAEDKVVCSTFETVDIS